MGKEDIKKKICISTGVGITLEERIVNFQWPRRLSEVIEVLCVPARTSSTEFVFSGLHDVSSGLKFSFSLIWSTNRFC